MSSAPALTVGWLATNTDDDAFDPAEADDQVARPAAVDLQESSVVDQPVDDGAHVHGLAGIFRAISASMPSSGSSVRSGRGACGGSSVLFDGR